MIFSAGFFYVPCLMSNLRDKSVGMHEKEMTDRLREGDEEAFRELVGEYQVRVMSLCLSMLHVREIGRAHV